MIQFEKKTELTLEYSLLVRGKFGRNRKERFECFVLAETPREAPKALPELMELMRAKVAEEKVKPGAKLMITVNKVELEHRDYGKEVIITTRLLEVFGSTKLHEEVLA